MNLKHTFVPAAAAAVLAMLISLPVSAQPTPQQATQAYPAKHSNYGQTLAQKANLSNKTKAKVSKAAVKKAPVNIVSPKDLESALEMLDKALLLVKTEAREKAKPGKITNCAFDAMTLFMEDNKLTSDFFKQIDVEATPEEANKALRSQFVKAATTYPQLMKDQMLTMAALKGIMRATDDPYTVYMTPDEYKNLNEQMSGGNFGGIGIVMGLSGDEKDPADSRVLVINKVMEKGPAARVGLRNNDEITHISGKSTYGMNLLQCSKLLRGEAGSTVKLTIRRPSSGHVFDVSLTREVIHVDTLKHEVIEQDGVKVGYLALGIFGESTNSEMEEAVRDLEEQGCQAYIIDVRNNSGGYVSAPVALAAACLDIPILLMEQNAFLGKSAKFIAYLADKVCLSWPGDYSPAVRAKAVLTGNPVRMAILLRRKAEAKQVLHIPAQRRCVVVMGGSQGASSLNKAILAALPSVVERELTLIHLTGPKHIEEVKLRSADLVSGHKLDYRPLAYSDDMASLYAVADLVVCRSGATTLAEITARGLPSILVPYPYAAENHQEANARILESKGAAQVILDNQVEAELGGLLLSLLEDQAKLAAMVQASATLGRPEATEAVITQILEVIYKNRTKALAKKGSKSAH